MITDFLNIAMNSVLHKTFYIFYLVLIITILSGCGDETVTTPTREVGTMTDIDGTIYPTIKIGNQWWMQENLKVTRFRNGVEIHNASEKLDWIKTHAAYCVYENNIATPGLLYNFYAISDQNNIAPNGWHIPTDEEWKELEVYLGMHPDVADKVNFRGLDEGNKLKIEAPIGWSEFKSIYGTNESGFKALAGSCRLFNGVFGVPGLSATGFWWTASTHKDEGWYRYLDYKKSNIFRYYGSKNYGFSIRCVKD